MSSFRPHRRLGLVAFAATALLAAAPAAARAEPGAGSSPASDGGIRLSSPYDAAQALKAAGLARTSVERRFEDRAATASLGFLCGRQADPDARAGASAYGSDPHGRFLGAQLRFAFR
jgi:hypothetical protein